jgi:hypothetical protein
MVQVIEGLECAAVRQHVARVPAEAKNQPQALLVEAEALLAQEVALSERCAYGERWLCGAVLDSTMRCSRDPTNSARVHPGQTGIVLLRSAFR